MTSVILKNVGITCFLSVVKYLPHCSLLAVKCLPRCCFFFQTQVVGDGIGVCGCGIASFSLQKRDKDQLYTISKISCWIVCWFWSYRVIQVSPPQHLELLVADEQGWQQAVSQTGAPGTPGTPGTPAQFVICARVFNKVMFPKDTFCLIGLGVENLGFGFLRQCLR